MTALIQKKVSVVIPVYQCVDRLGPHLRMLRGLVGEVQEFIWVVTESSDGSHRVAKQAHSEFPGTFLERPKGLYEAWNEGIRCATSPFVYISTVGESITREGLRAMVMALDNNQADLCFSPPNFISDNPKTLNTVNHWPIQRFRRILARHDGKIVPVSTLASLQILSGLSSLLGSVASCLFRASMLQARPYPDDFQSYGDTAWCYRHLCEIRTVFLDQVFANFHIHDLSKRKVVSQDLRRCLEAFSKTYERFFPSGQLGKLALDLQEARENLDRVRKPHPAHFWWLSTFAWSWRWRRDRLARKLLMSADA